MSKFCKKLSTIGVLLLVCSVIIGMPKILEYPPYMGSHNSSISQ